MSSGGTPQWPSAGTRILHHRGGAADVELVAALRQGAAQQFNVHVPGVLEVNAHDVVVPGTAVDHVQVEVRMRTGQLLKGLLERMISSAPDPIVKMDRALWLLGETPAQHAHHWRDADTARDEHSGHFRIGINEKMPRRRPRFDDIPLVDLVMKVVG